MRKLSKSYYRNRADKLLQDYIKKENKGVMCLSCGERVMTVGHHFVSKKNSLALRYYIPNLIPLCKNCHFLVHNQPHLVEPKICFLLGEEWYKDLMEQKRQKVKYNLGWIKTQAKILQELLAL